jgi:hypothetical protein
MLNVNKLEGSDILPDDFVFIMGIFLFLWKFLKNESF